MIYGKGSKGNYPVLAKLARKLPVFPDVGNRRSMLYIDNLCEFLCKLMLSGEGGVYFPQNGEYTKTAEMVKMISDAVRCCPGRAGIGNPAPRRAVGKKIWVTKLLNPAVSAAGHVPGKISGLVGKAFGNSVYAQEISEYEGLEYRVVSLEDSIKKSEGAYAGVRFNSTKREHSEGNGTGSDRTNDRRMEAGKTDGYRAGNGRKANGNATEICGTAGVRKVSRGEG